MSDNNEKDVKTFDQKNPLLAKRECQRQKIDLLLCQKNLGFNDSECKYYIMEYQKCKNRIQKKIVYLD